MRFLALLRGINVGGNSIIRMVELKTALEKDGFKNPKTYIQSGNVFIDSESKPDKVARDIEASIKKHFNLDVSVAVFTQKQWQAVIDQAPDKWGKDKDWKHNLLILLEPYDINQVIDSIGELKPDIEFMVAGEGVLYQSLSISLFGRTTTGKLASKSIYKRMTIRNFNTTTKLLNLFED